MLVNKRMKRVAKKLLYLGRWSRQRNRQPRSYEEHIYHALVRPGDVCFDVGANQGEVSLFLAQLVGTSGLIVAFEPVWPMYCQLSKRIQYDTALKAPIITMPVGLADTEKQAIINVPNGEFGMGSMADASAWAAIQLGAQIDAYQVEFTTLDAFLAKTSSRNPTFIKIDVEGAEFFVLQGASKLFDSGHRPLMLIEVFAPWERAFGYKPWAPLSWLLERDYRFMFACPSGLVDYMPTESEPFPPEYEMGYNILAYHGDTHAKRIEALEYLRMGLLKKQLSMVPPPQPNYLV